MAVARRSLVLGAVAAALVAGALAVWVPQAQAHASLKTSDPAANTSVATSPSQILLTFTEPPDPTLSIVKVVDASGKPAPGVGAAQSVSGQSSELSVPVRKPLPKGVYTVNWRSVSAVDGHVEVGAFAFGVGAKPKPGSVVTVSLQNSSPGLSAAAAAGRWLLYIGLALLVGAASTLLLVYRARLPRGGLTLLRVAVAVAVLGLVVMVATERLIVGVPSLLPLFVTREGLFLVALGLALAFCGLAVAAVDLYPGRTSLIVVGATGALAVFVHVLAGHADAPSALQPLNVLAQWVHMTAIGVWTGGLVWLLLGIRGLDREERAAAVGKFSRIATVTLVVVVVTGGLRALAEIQPLSNLISTSYGQTLLIKVGLVGALVIFAAFNHYRFVPALSRTDASGDVAGRHFKLDSRAELGIVVVVLAATAILSGLAPANAGSSSASGGSAPQTVASGSDYATTVRVTLRVTPGSVGSNEYDVAVDAYDTGNQLPGVSNVTLDFTMPTRPNVNPSTLALTRASDGSWQGRGLELSIVGTWSVTVLVQEATGGVEVPLTLVVTR
jgi:copper transport protein